MSPNRQKYIDLFFDFRHSKDLSDECFTSLSESEQTSKIERAKEGIGQQVDELLVRIEQRDINLLLNSTFHPDNKISRQVFSNETGLTLPKGVIETRAFISNWVGPEKMEAYLQERENARLAKEKERSDIESARLNAIHQKVKENIPIDGDTLVDLCRYLGVELHPRVAGVLRKRVVEINKDGASVKKIKQASGLSSEPYKAYLDCMNCELRITAQIIS